MFPQPQDGTQPTQQPAQQPVEQPAQQPQYQPPAQQPAQPEPTIENLILENPANQPQGQPQQQPAQQPQGQEQPTQQPTQQPQQQPQTQPQEEAPVTDPYANGGVRTVRAEFDKYLDEKFPITGKLDINSIDKKDPEAFAKFMNDMQEASRNDVANTAARQRAEAEFQDQIFQPVYSAFPKLKQEPVTDGMVRALYRGFAADNPNISPVQVAQAFSNYTRQLYASAEKAVRANIESIPTPPAGQQGRAATQILNQGVVDKYASGSVDDVAQLVAAMQGKGVGGL